MPDRAFSCYVGAKKRPPTPTRAGLRCGVEVGACVDAVGGLGSNEAIESGWQGLGRCGRRCQVWRTMGRIADVPPTNGPKDDKEESRVCPRQRKLNSNLDRK